MGVGFDLGAYIYRCIKMDLLITGIYNFYYSD
jgi:hypothetical protein